MLILLDGVPLNLPVHGHIEGYADWSVVPLRFLSGIQVTSGPASPIYGDFALGGVLEATTLAPGTGNTATMEVSTVGNLTGAARWSRHADAGLPPT
jgi:outer membrane cobalamin receptor